MESCKDKGWSWVVLFGVFIAYTLSFGFLPCFGVFLVDWQKDFDVSAQIASWCTAVLLAGFGISGMFKLSLFILMIAISRGKSTAIFERIIIIHSILLYKIMFLDFV